MGKYWVAFVAVGVASFAVSGWAECEERRAALIALDHATRFELAPQA